MPFVVEDGENVQREEVDFETPAPSVVNAPQKSVMKSAVLESVKQIQKVQQSMALGAPAGYIPIALSLKGRLGVPEVVHVRNFSTENLIDLSMASDELLPERLIHLLKELIYEPVRVEEWPEKAIVELLIKLYANFFTPMITSTPFPWDRSDYNWLIEHDKKDQALDLSSGKWVPRIDIDLRVLKIKEFPEDVKSYLTVKNKRNASDPLYVKAKFLAYTRIGDSIALKKAADNKFEEEDKKYEKIRQMTTIRNDLIQRGITDNLPVISEKEYLDWQSHAVAKAIYLSKLTKALYLVAFNDIDLSKATLEEKLKYSEDPRFDINVTRKVDQQFAQLDFGIDPNIQVKNPITGEVCTRRFSFRLLDILQAVQSAQSDEYDFSYDD